ncbi:LysE family translocator [Gallaecimonas xiamenensis]|uniref:Lysine exporter protein LysE/YggA n=1 Tax=Gallaecimonas xiamenensis 3-C-1 TaxID=745411 RepID=K2K9G0_9GAMM|nr:LysE family translocator [Gallaecimonas xiamenensis]EKE73950.1 lysine exporter protein LysE/YggA [Gallaecimonas xiamenensis 3-C-1]
MTLQSALSFFLAIYIFCLTPGPGVFAILGRALTKGAGACLWLGLGMILSDLLYLLAACFGLAALATHFGGVFTLIRFAGAAYLLYLAYRMWTATPTAPGEEHPGRGDGAWSFVQGMAISLSNPKVILFYMAFLPTFMDLTALSGQDIVLVLALTFVGLFLGVWTVALFADRARLWFRSPRAMKGLNRGAGSLMAAAGLFLASRG